MINELREIAVDQIDRNPDQPRTAFDDVTLAELAESIKTHGVIQSVEVEATGDGRYRLHHGERRLRAARLAGLATIPAIVAAPQDADTLLVRGLLENLHREDLNPIDEARVYDGLLRLGWSRTRIARETGRSLPLVAGRLAWLRLEPEIQRHVALEHLSRDGRLADALYILPTEARVALANKLAARAVGLQGSLKAAAAAAERLARREEAAAERRQVAETAKQHGRVETHPTPMIRHGAPGVPVNANGQAPKPGRTIAEAADAMCRTCYLKPQGDIIPSWAMIEEAAAATCAECQKRDGPAIPDICRNCPGAAMVAAMVAMVEVR